MGWSLRIGRIAGTEVKVHVTFFLLVGFYALQGYREGGAAAAVVTTLFLLALFGCVLLHEFGHILMARRFGVRTPDVILLPIGGVARLERMPDEPKQELLIALAGPAVTLTIAVAIYAALAVTGKPPTLAEAIRTDAPFAAQMMGINVMLLLFNLIPAFPMDGGRVLRALLAHRLGLLRATRLAAGIGQTLAVGLGLLGLFGNPILLLIALFVFMGAASEAAMVETRAAARGIKVEQAMVTHYRVLPVHARLDSAVQMLLDGEQREFPVVDNLGRVEGILTRENLIKGLSTKGPDSTVGEVMTSPVPVIPAGTEFELALDQLRDSGLPALPVAGPEGKLAGLLTRDNIADLILVRRAIAR